MTNIQQWALELSTETHISRVDIYPTREDAEAAMNRRAERDGEMIEAAAWWQGETHYGVQFKNSQDEWDFAPFSYIIREITSDD